MARPRLRATQCASAWHDLILHTVSTLSDAEIALRLILTIYLTLPWWEATQLAGWLEARFLLGSPSCLASSVASRGELLASRPQTQTPWRRAQSRGAHAICSTGCSTEWDAVGASEHTMAHIHRLTVLLLTHMRRTRNPRDSCVEPRLRSCDRVVARCEHGRRHGGAHV